MRAILATNKKGYIGLNGELPWRSKEDLAHFKALTNGCKLLVGYNTAKTLPNLPGREIVIYDRDKDLSEYESCDWCIGGKKTYETFCHLFTELHISMIDDETIGDVFYPELTGLNEDCKFFYYTFKTK